MQLGVELIRWKAWLPMAATGMLVLALATSSVAQEFSSSAGPITVETFANGLDHPWAIAFLPSGRILVTERPGRLRLIDQDGRISTAVAGIPNVFASGHAGLHDVALDRDYVQNRTIYFCYSEPVSGGARTAMARARLVEEGTPQLDDLIVIFRQEGPLSTGNHFGSGCRIAQTPDGNLFLALGEHGDTYRDQAQNLGNHLGKIVRVKPDGSVPADNPFVGRPDAKPEIWSYGHRNPQGLALQPLTGRLWEHEHGPRGGDEINIIEMGRNYGWPVIGYGIAYDYARIHESTHKEGMEQPVWYCDPSIAPSGMAFYTGNIFPAWRGNLFVGALAGKLLAQLELDGEKVIKEERLLQELRERIRDVRQGPDGALWLATDNSAGRILRVVTERP
jgi:glucose/arabinose dehydrogenase